MKARHSAVATAVLSVFFTASAISEAADGGLKTLERADRPGEGWFGAATVLGGQTPFGLRTGKVEFDQTSFALYNQAAPLMLSTQGGWVWSDEPLVCSYANGTWRYRSRGTILSGTAKEGTLAGAYAEVSRRFFPPSGRAPDELFVRAPQYNTWIELGHDQTQEKILAYARDVVTNGFPAGVLMIDHGWQREFGDWRFRPEAFPDPKRMMDELHALGFRTLLWVVPFVSTNAPAYAELKRKGALLADGSGAPAPITWWSGTDAVLDLREKAAGDWFRGELKRLAALGADGFKLDGGDPEYYDPVRYGLPAPVRDPECARQSELWARLGLEWPFNELRATWKCGGLPLVERLCDKGANMAAVRELIPSLVNLGLMGHPFACPDMIGGGMLTVFRENKFNPEVYVRSAQVHALSPMMQFSASPWRRLDAAHLAAVRKAVAIRQQHADYLVRTMRESAKTGLPMIRSLEFVFPGRGYACVNDQFMLGEDLMVAPQMKDGARERTVRIPPGTWRADDGTVTTGPCETTVSTPLDRLPHYERVRTAGVKCPDAFTVPKPGAVKPTGWLREWAQAAAKGATGRMEEVDEEFRKAWAADFTPRGKNLNWFNGTWSCEGGAYWFDGLVRLAYQLDDPGLKALARRRLDPVLDHMTETPIGFCWWLDRRQPSHFDEVFASSDWMVNWVAGMFARPVSAWYAATGDPRAARALDCALGDDYWNRGFSRSRDVAATPGSVITIPSGAMEAYRITGSGKIAAALETYARDYAAHPRRETYGPPPFKGIEETMNLKRREQQGLKIPLRHGVVANESLLSLFTSARVTGDAALMQSWREWMKLLDTRARLPYGATVMDEEWGHPGPRRGTETCALAAELWSRIHYLAALGEAGFADDVERGFFNAAPAAVTRDWREHVYFQTPNRLSADDSGRLSVWHQGAGARRQVNYAPKHDPLCCTAGLNRLVPEYVQAMWMTTADGGVAAALYGPCTFETELAGGRFAAEERTDYPFGETVEIAVTAAPGGKFPLAVRVPGWCGARAEISVNGEPAKGLDAAGFVRLERTWKAGDAVRLRFPMAVRVETAVDADETHETFASVLAGPLLFAKGFAEKSANEPAEKTFVPVLDTASAAAAQLTRKPLARPWNWPLDAPVKVTVRDAAGAPLELVPYGCTKLRASMLRMADSPVSKHQ